jgi:hypothetical protein
VLVRTDCPVTLLLLLCYASTRVPDYSNNTIRCPISSFKSYREASELQKLHGLDLTLGCLYPTWWLMVSRTASDASAFGDKNESLLRLKYLQPLEGFMPSFVTPIKNRSQRCLDIQISRCSICCLSLPAFDDSTSCKAIRCNCDGGRKSVHSSGKIPAAARSTFATAFHHFFPDLMIFDM